MRGHWEVENKAHYVLDVTYREDDSRIRRENAAENIAVARRFALNLARLHPQKNSMKGKLKQAMWSDDFREKIILGHEADLNKLPKKISKKVTLAVTCLDQFEEKITVAKETSNLIELRKGEFLNYLFDKTRFDNYIFSYGPTRENCQPD